MSEVIKGDGGAENQTGASPELLSKTERIVFDLELDSAERRLAASRERVARDEAYLAELLAKRQDIYGRQ